MSAAGQRSVQWGAESQSETSAGSVDAEDMGSVTRCRNWRDWADKPGALEVFCVTLASCRSFFYRNREPPIWPTALANQVDQARCHAMVLPCCTGFGATLR